MRKRKYNDDNISLAELKAEIFQLNKENTALQISVWGKTPCPSFLKALVEASYSMRTLKVAIQKSKISPEQKQILLSGIQELPDQKQGNCSPKRESEAIVALLTLDSQNPPCKKHNKSSSVEFLQAFSAIKTTLADQKSATRSSDTSIILSQN